MNPRQLMSVCLAALWLSPQVASAAPLYFSGLGTTYQPGSSVEFDVGLPPITNLGAYNVDLVLASTSGVAGVDFYFDVAATIPSPTNYVFPSTVNYFDAANVDSPSQHRLTLSDFEFGGVDVVSGINDLVAHVVIQTALGFSESLSLSFDTGGLFLDTPDLVPTPVEGFATIRADTNALSSPMLNPVPEPSTLLLIVLAAMLTRAGRPLI